MRYLFGHNPRLIPLKLPGFKAVKRGANHRTSIPLGPGGDYFFLKIAFLDENTPNSYAWTPALTRLINMKGRVPRLLLSWSTMDSILGLQDTLGKG